MKISVQGTLIETEKIYCISEIYENERLYCFDIVSFNNMCETVTQSNHELAGLKMPTLEEFPSTELLFEARKKYWAELPLKNKAKLERMRDEIVKIWSDNQPKIPVFDIKNY